MQEAIRRGHYELADTDDLPEAPGRFVNSPSLLTDDEQSMVVPAIGAQLITELMPEFYQNMWVGDEALQRKAFITDRSLNTMVRWGYQVFGLLVNVGLLDCP